MNNWFFVFFGFWQEKPVFLQESFWQGCQKYFDVSSGTLTEQITRMEVLKTRRFPYNFLKFSGQGWKIFSRVGKTAIDFRWNSLWKLFSKREKFALFFRFWANVYFQRNFLPELQNPQSMYPCKFLGKNNFWNKYNLSHFFRTLIKKTLSRKENFFSDCHNCNPRVQRHFLRRRFFLKKFCLFICSGVWAILLVYWQKTVRVSEKQPANTEKKLDEKNGGKIVFLKHFWISSRKIWTIRQKILAGLSKLHSKCSEEHI